MKSLRTIFGSLRLLVLTLTLIFSGMQVSAEATASDPVMTGRTTIRLDDTGHSDVNIALQTQLIHYTTLKQVGSNFNMLARQLGMDNRDWSKHGSLSGRFVDSTNEVNLEFKTPGAVRNIRGNRWIYAIQGESNCQLIAITGTKITLMTVESTAVGLGTMIIDVELPDGATNAAFDKARNEISYDLTPVVTNGNRASLEFTVDHKPMVMSALAKNYSNPKCNYLWAARSVARNTGDQVLNNYRVRFRFAELGSWTAWQRSAHVYPGQTVVDPFFPIFDLDKVMAMNGSRPAVIEVEYEYETLDGRKAQESDTLPVQMLSRNEVVYSSLNETEITGFADRFDYVPALMTAMTTPADPVVQQLAGRVSGMAAETYGQTIGAIYSDSECVAYMSALWHFMQSNRIAYQSPNGNNPQGVFGQHVKYARDVLRNRAGTCIDLAITWASVCEAAGLEPAVVMIPGHAFPAIRLPQSRQWLAVESTMLNDSFKAAVERGEAVMKQALTGDHYLVDITAVRDEGILGLDLPNVSEDFLTNLGYRFNAAQLTTPPGTNPNNTPAVHVDPATNEQQTQFNPNGTTTEVGSLVGNWGGYGIENGRPTWVGLAFYGDATFALRFQYTDNNGTEADDNLVGTWGMRNGQIVLTMANSGQVYEYPFEFTGNQLKFCVLGGTQVVALDRLN